MDLRRWQSIDRKLPLMASGLVLLTAVILGWAAYVRLERALLQSAGSRLFSAAHQAAQMIQRPTARVVDSSTRVANEALRGFVSGRVSRDSALAALGHLQTPGDTSKFYSALLDSSGKVLLAYHRPPDREVHWPAGAIARGEVRGDTMHFGPFESVAGKPALTMVRQLRASTAPDAPVIGYVVDGRSLMASGGRAFRGIIGEESQLLIGQPGLGVWTDFEDITAPPPIQPRGDTIVLYRDGVGASARIAGSHWVVWVSQPAHSVLAPARRLWWSMIPIGLVIALIAAAVMWRMAHRIAGPLAQLTEAAEDIAKDANALPVTAELPVAIRDADEVTRLRYAFDRMSARVAERETLELQLRHAQKMEAVGRLAGGIAHDFNNLLTAIRSYADLMIEDMPQWDSKRGDVEEIRKAAHRASALTAQLLAFSRKQMLQPRVLDTAAVLQDVQGMLKRLLIEDIRLSVDTPAGVWPVKADRGQLEQVIVNLAVNARDAMPQGGALRIAARNEDVSSPVATKTGAIPPGQYVALSVSDTGLGMDAVTQSRAFEPFFTTKAVGQGTGLGLATVHGIVAQSGGHVTLESAPSEGTTFTVYLPRAKEAGEPARVSGPRAATQGNNETILLVEDEPAVRSLARRVLVRAGFRVIESTTPKDALRLAREHFQEIRLVLSDVVMPEMSGPVLVQQIAKVCPGAKVLYISGYNDDEMIGRGLGSSGMQLLQKPFSAQQLVERVRTALDGS